jgi:hypothetical protein
MSHAVAVLGAGSQQGCLFFLGFDGAGLGLQRQLPQADGFIGAAREGLAAVRREGDAGDRSGVAIATV